VPFLFSRGLELQPLLVIKKFKEELIANTNELGDRKDSITIYLKL
jgi:hypothetical protein